MFRGLLHWFKGLFHTKCDGCGDPIIKVNGEWVHKDGNIYRHYAEPKQ